MPRPIEIVKPPTQRRTEHRAAVTLFFQANPKPGVFDAPCEDMHWMQHFLPEPLVWWPDYNQHIGAFVYAGLWTREQIAQALSV